MCCAGVRNLFPANTTDDFFLSYRVIRNAPTFWRLGLRNVWNVGWYQLRLRLGIHPVQRVRRKLAGIHFFAMPEGLPATSPPTSHWRDHSLHFGWHQEPLGGGPPDWHRNPLNGARAQGVERPWWKLSDFGSGAGDIKAVWEASRFDWVLAFAQQARCGDAAALDRLNIWLADWVRHNPPYNGPNWKCGQETSIRVLHLLLAARLLGQLNVPQPELVQLVEAHLARIALTLAYAMAQDNNHGTSEAAALFIGGDWLVRQGAILSIDTRQARAWAEAGRRWLENRVSRLIEPDGGFSQHSVNYHRLMLDTLSLAELWRQWFELPAFSKAFYELARAATQWLHALADPETGQAPNLGANDGANLLPLTGADYCDYRPTVQLATGLFAGERAYSCTGPHEDHLAWFGVELPAESRPLASNKTFHAKGYILLRNASWKALFRYPHYRFRPGHCDALHVDLWYGSDNLLRDAGSYSYNAEPGMSEYFSGPAGHNVVQFDGRDPMPRIGPFLRGAWLEADVVSGPEEREAGLHAAAGYRDWQGAHHRRDISLATDGLRVVDEVGGFQTRAVLRWRLAPGDWKINENTVSCERVRVAKSTSESTGANTPNESAPTKHSLSISSSVSIHSLRLVSGWESRYYLKKEPLPVLEIEIRKPGRLISEYRLEP